MWHHKPGTLSHANGPTTAPNGNNTINGGGGEASEKVHNVKKELKLDANERWNEALKRMKEDAGYTTSIEGRNSARERWARGTLYAHRLAEGVRSSSPSSSTSSSDDGEDGESEAQEEEQWVKHLEELHYLEMIDPKHRYGSNLKYYHRRWMEEDTEDNFFKWLDRGAGRTLSLPDCPRQHLESATIRYLTPEQRYHYLVHIDPSSGLLRWAHSGELVDTTPGVWEDRGEGRGVARVDSPLPSSPAEGHSPDEGPPFAETLKLRLRKKIKHQQWIYVASSSYELYIGLKSSGAFQHSSFLAGGAIASAGTVRVKQGRVGRMDPLSGHYRISIEHFKRFVEEMQRRGMDVSNVSVSRAVATLWGDRQLKQTKQRLRHLLAGVSSLPAKITMPVPRRSARPLLSMTPLSGSSHSSPAHTPSRTPPSHTPSRTPPRLSPSSSPSPDLDPPTPTRRSALLLGMTPLGGEEEKERREMLYGRPPSVKAMRRMSLGRVVEVEEPREEGGVGGGMYIRGGEVGVADGRRSS